MARTVAAGLLRPLAGVLLGLALAAPLPLGSARADSTFRTVYSFGGSSSQEHPCSGLIADRRTGLFYGIKCYGSIGSVYQLARPSTQGGAWTETVIYRFQGSFDGERPQGDLALGHAGELYGTTSQGGIAGNGTVFVLTPPATSGGPWTHTVLHRFLADEGVFPLGGLVVSRTGALYGTTPLGGQSAACIHGCGTAFELAPPKIPGGAWTATVLHTFEGGEDGTNPVSWGLTAYAGDLYGTTDSGGVGNYGVVFRLRPPAAPGGVWTKTNIYTFRDVKIAAYPNGRLTAASSGVLYGTTYSGGTYPPFNGTVFSLTPPAVSDGSWDFAVLHTFNANQEGSPAAPTQLAVNSTGELFGTTVPFGCQTCSEVFKLTPPALPGGIWAIRVLHQFNQFFFSNRTPTTGRLLLSRAGVMLGITNVEGAFGSGSVFEIRP